MKLFLPQLCLKIKFLCKKTTTALSLKLAIAEHLMCPPNWIQIFSNDTELSNDSFPKVEYKQKGSKLTAKIIENEADFCEDISNINEDNIKAFENMGFKRQTIVSILNFTKNYKIIAHDALRNASTAKIDYVRNYDPEKETDASNSSSNENQTNQIPENVTETLAHDASLDEKFPESFEINVSQLIKTYFDSNKNIPCVICKYPDSIATEILFTLFYLANNISKTKTKLNLKKKLKDLLHFIIGQSTATEAISIIGVKDASELKILADSIFDQISNSTKLIDFARTYPDFTIICSNSLNDIKLQLTKNLKKFLIANNQNHTKESDHQHDLSNQIKVEMPKIEEEENVVELDENGFIKNPNDDINIIKVISSYYDDGCEGVNLMQKFPGYSFGYLVYLIYITYCSLEKRNKSLKKWSQNEIRHILELSSIGMSTNELKQYCPGRTSAEISLKKQTIFKNIKDNKKLTKFIEFHHDFVPKNVVYDQFGIPAYFEQLFTSYKQGKKLINITEDAVETVSSPHDDSLVENHFLQPSAPDNDIKPETKLDIQFISGSLHLPDFLPQVNKENMDKIIDPSILSLMSMC